jgi:hypothetical protein
MLLAPVPVHFGFTVPSSLALTNPMFQHEERCPVLMADDAPENQALPWESLWIDVGGEG